MTRGAARVAVAVATLAAGLAVSVLACTSAPTAEEITPPAPTGPSRTDFVLTGAAARAQLIIEERCGTCHRSDLPTAIEGALAVYDLDQPVWWQRLRPEQRQSLGFRLTDNGDLSPEDAAVIRRFLADIEAQPPPPPPKGC